MQMKDEKLVKIIEIRNRAVAELISETLAEYDIPNIIKTTGALAGAGGYPIGTASGELLGTAFAILVLESLKTKAQQILDMLSETENLEKEL
jgi:hypothetical protein